MKSLALAESPAQLLNVLEWAHSTADGTDGLVVVVLAPGQDVARMQLHRMTELARTAGCSVRWQEPRSGTSGQLSTLRAMATDCLAAQRLVIGDPFSGLMQMFLSVSRAREIVVVDDGSATIEFVDQLVAGHALTRWHRAGAVRHPFASLARKRLTQRNGRDLTIFTSMPVRTDGGARIVRNEFAWTRGRYVAPTINSSADLVGTSLVETGVVDHDHYLSAVRILISNHAVGRYLAHRKESPEKLRRISALGCEIVRPDLPLELFARLGPIGHKIVSFPSTIVHTLPLLLSDTSARVVICDIDSEWLTPQSSPRSGTFLSAVNETARLRHGLEAVAAA